MWSVSVVCVACAWLAVFGGGFLFCFWFLFFGSLLALLAFCFSVFCFFFGGPLALPGVVSPFPSREPGVLFFLFSPAGSRASLGFGFSGPPLGLRVLAAFVVPGLACLLV